MTKVEKIFRVLYFMLLHTSEIIYYNKTVTLIDSFHFTNPIPTVIIIAILFTNYIPLL